jgi:hypothetical protein
MVCRTFGRWTVIDDTSRRWLCRCACGTVKRVDRYTLLKDLSTSCGCRNSELTATRNRKHAMNRTPEYRTWLGAKRRAFATDRKCSADYALRGISMCPEWANDFTAFLRDMGPKPTAAHTIERIDNNRGYEPGNCCWGTRLEQGRNRRCVKALTLNGVTNPRLR